MKQPSLVRLVNVSMKYMIRNIDRTLIREESERFTERKLAVELGADVLHPPKVTLREFVLIVVRVGGAAVDWYGDWSGDVCEKSLVDRSPVNAGIGVGDGLPGVVVRGHNGGSMGPDGEQLRRDHLLHLLPPLPCSPTLVIDREGGQTGDGSKNLGHHNLRGGRGGGRHRL